ncbi:MAG: hypothetical protein RL325_220 [Planctomycetota bacterium]
MCAAALVLSAMAASVLSAAQHTQAPLPDMPVLSGRPEIAAVPPQLPTPAPPATEPAPRTGSGPAKADVPVPSPQAESLVDRRERLRASAEDALRQSVVPKPLSRERFVSLLTASDPSLLASTALLEAHSTYQSAIDRQNDAASRQILRLLPAAYTFDAARESFDPRPTPELVALLALRDKSIRNIRAAERRLLDAIDSEVPATARAAYARALLAWRIEEMPRDALLPSTRASLLEVLPKVRVDAATLAAIEPFVTDYARALATAVQDRTRVLADADTARAITETSAGTLWRYAPEAIAREVERSLAELDDREFATEIAIRTIHFDAVSRLRSRMQPRDGRLFVELWQRTLHPSLFEDERLLSRMVEEALAHPGFSPDQSTALLDALESIYQRLEPLSRKACESADLVLPRLVERTPASMTAEIDARLDLIEVQQKRRAIVKEALIRIRGMLGDADPAQSARVDDAIASIDSLGRADAFDQKSLIARRAALGAGEPNAPAGESARSAVTTDPSATAGPGSPAPPRESTSDEAADDSEQDRATGDRSARNGRSGRGARRTLPSGTGN